MRRDKRLPAAKPNTEMLEGEGALLFHDKDSQNTPCFLAGYDNNCVDADVNMIVHNPNTWKNPEPCSSIW